MIYKFRYKSSLSEFLVRDIVDSLRSDELVVVSNLSDDLGGILSISYESVIIGHRDTIGFFYWYREYIGSGCANI